MSTNVNLLMKLSLDLNYFFMTECVAPFIIFRIAVFLPLFFLFAESKRRISG